MMLGYRDIPWDKQMDYFRLIFALYLFKRFKSHKFQKLKPRDIMILYHHAKYYDNMMLDYCVMTRDKQTGHFRPIFDLLSLWDIQKLKCFKNKNRYVNFYVFIPVYQNEYHVM